MRKDKKEIRDLLLGRTVMDEEGCLVVPDAGTIRVSSGILDGTGAARFLGVSGKSRGYESDLEGEELMTLAGECMRNIGRAVHLRRHPEAEACLLRYLLTRPALLVFRLVEGRGILTVWTGRGIMSWVSRLRAVRAFERHMSEAIRLSPEPPPEEPEEKKRRRKRKKAQPEEARAEYGEAPEYGGGHAEGYDAEYAEDYGSEYDGEYAEEYTDEYNGGYDGNEEEFGYAEEYGETAQGEERES